MPAPTIYRSSDLNAPVLFSGQGSLITLLDAILINGYGSSFATGSITNDGTAPSDGDTLTIGSITYTFRTSIAGQPANSIAISTVTGTAQRIILALNGNGVAASDYSVGTVANPDVYSPTLVNAFPVALVSRKGGSAANSIALARTSAGTPHINVSGTTLTGGGGSNTKAGAGWAKPYVGSSWAQSVYRQPAGCGFYLQVDDTGPGTGGARDARCCGWETMSAYGVGTNQFPTTALVGGAQLVTCRKSVSLDATARSWIALVDDRTFFLFTLTVDSAANYHGMTFGDFYSYLKPTDPYKCLIVGGYSESATVTTNGLGTQHQAAQNTSFSGNFIARNFLGLGGATGFAKMGDTGFTNVTATTPPNITGKLGFPNPQDGGLYVAPFRILDCNNPGSSFTGTNPVINLRGRMRGLYHVCNDVTPVSDGDIFQGAGDYAGRTFMLVKFVHGQSANAYFAVETTPWEIS